ncbi:type II secretion system protein [Clostridium niameyense]|uniref:Type II secretion system protein n=2 Tax=Clostridium niameyense TaxID=1622073 RepID=A0A6M0R9P8_9CLOT|nr:type II secretion system protein [Clostridium niameyense]
MKMNRKKGFTLIELMVVMSIIIVLASFLVPKFISYKQKAKDTKAISTAKQIQVAAMSSYNENDDKFETSVLQEDIKKFTGVSCNISGDENCVNITYASDNKNYIVEVNANDTGYKVTNSDNKVIFLNGKEQ